MRDCFQDTPDLTPYTALPNRVPLDEINPPLQKLRGMAYHWAKQSMLQNWEVEDRLDEDVVNRVLWFAARGNELGGVALPFHCDGSDLVGLLCLENGISGGLSAVASSVGIHNTLVADRPDLAPRGASLSSVPCRRRSKGQSPARRR